MSDILTCVDPTAVATVTLNRGDRRNAVTLPMWRELRTIFAGLGENPEVRVVILTGAGGHFCSGADIKEFGKARSGSRDGAAYERDVDACTETLMAVPKPTIAAIEGVCIGGGCALAMACDFRVGAASARFGIPAARLGVVYGLLDSRNLLALVGLAHAKEILFTGRQFDAHEALRIGFMDRVVEGSAAPAAAELAAQLAENAPLSIAGAKLILNALAHGEAERRAAEIKVALERSLESADYHEGVRAFLDKRRPVFKGR